MIRVLFVCLGNICRSPTAHGVFVEQVRRAGLSHLIEVDSAGTSSAHQGEGADPRTQSAAKVRGYDLSSLHSRPLSSGDFDQFDYLLAMDLSNLALMQQMAPANHPSCVRLFLDYADSELNEVPDPYYGGAKGFDQVLDLVEQGGVALLEHLKTTHRL